MCCQAQSSIIVSKHAGRGRLPNHVLHDRKSFSTVFMVVSIVGWIGNGFIVAVTIRSKSLHGPCNILIAIQAVNDIILQMAHIPFIYFAYSEILVSFYTCWKVNFIFVSTIDLSTLLMFFIALDRLIAAKRPQLYKSLRPNLYIGGIMTVCLAYCTIFKIVTYMSLTEELTLCLIGQAVTGFTMQIWLSSSALVNFAVVGLYYALTKILKNASASEYRKINRSLKTMILVYIFGWLMTMFGCTVALLVSPNQRVFTAFEIPLGTFASINIAAPFFIYYFRSTLYRKEILRLFGCARRASTVTTISHQASSCNL